MIKAPEKAHVVEEYISPGVIGFAHDSLDCPWGTIKPKLNMMIDIIIQVLR